MALAEQISSASQSVQGKLQFVVQSGEKPQVFIGDPDDGIPKRQGEYQWHTIEIADSRALADSFDLEREGFELQSHATAVKDFYDEDEVTSVYYAEIEQLVKAATGANSVHIFDHTIRVEADDKREAKDVRAPVPVVHNDYTEKSGPQRVKDLLGDKKAEKYLNHRFVEINVWRSIGDHPVETTPLTVADAQSIAPEDFIATDLVYKDRVGEIYQIAFNDNQRWHYFSKMQKNEVLLLKCYDTETDGRSRFSAHSAFKNSEAAADAVPRESIEVRTLVSFAPE